MARISSLLLDRNEGRDIARWRAIVRIGADRRPDPSKATDKGEVAVAGATVPLISSPPPSQSMAPSKVVESLNVKVKVASAKISFSAASATPSTIAARLWKLR